jgi:hypothetical protein
MVVRFAVIDLDCNEPMAAFDSIDDAEECRQELSQQDINAIVETIDDDNGYRLN